VSLKDPPRLLDSTAKTPNFVRDALDAGRADVPRHDQLARLAQRLPIDVPPPAGPGSAPAPVAAIPSALPGAIVGAALGLAVIGLHALLTRAEAPPTLDRGAPTALLAASSAVASPTPPRRNDTSTPPSTAPVRAVAAPAIPAAASADPSMRSADKSPTDPPIAPPAAPGSGQDLAGRSAGGDLGAQAPTIAGETEIQLLQRAQDALGSSPARALDILNQHAARFPGAGLGQEREVIAIDALVRLGRAGEARERAAAFAARFPTSAHLRRIGSLVPSAGIDSALHKNPDPAAPTGQQGADRPPKEGLP
jgi:hypothetical protein